MEQILIGSILGISFADDLKSRKVHNGLILGFFALSLSYVLSLGTIDLGALQTLGLCLVLCLPLVYFRILGAGDLKLFVVLTLFFGPSEFLSLFLLSMAWNCMGGVFKYFINLKTKIQTGAEALRFPFTYGILLAWLSLAYIPEGASLW